MKRDIDLIKEILLQMEESGNPLQPVKIDIENRSQNEVSYHIKLLHQAGLIEAENVSGTDSFKWIPISLTWHGHEFLDAIRNDTVWTKLKAKISEHGGNIPFQLLKELATQYARDHLL